MRPSMRALLVGAVVLALVWPGGSLPTASAKAMNLHRGSMGTKVLTVERRLDRLSTCCAPGPWTVDTPEPRSAP